MAPLRCLWLLDVAVPSTCDYIVDKPNPCEDVTDNLIKHMYKHGYRAFLPRPFERQSIYTSLWEHVLQNMRL